MKIYAVCCVLLSFLILSKGASAQVINGLNTYDLNTPKKELMIPNAFSPNNDGQNDVFKIVNLSDERILEFKIFNRWGTVLFKDEKNEHWWDGTYKGELQPMGVYGYVIRIGFPDGKIDTYKGTLTLVR